MSEVTTPEANQELLLADGAIFELNGQATTSNSALLKGDHSSIQGYTAAIVCNKSTVAVRSNMGANHSLLGTKKMALNENHTVPVDNAFAVIANSQTVEFEKQAANMINANSDVFVAGHPIISEYTNHNGPEAKTAKLVGNHTLREGNHALFGNSRMLKTNLDIMKADRDLLMAIAAKFSVAA